MTRAQAWERRISAAVEDWCASPFEWGTSDCLLALADIVKDVAGYDPAAEFRHRYRSARGALMATRRDGGFYGALVRIASERHWPVIRAADARIGAIGLVRNVEGARCGVIRFRGGFWVGRRDGGGFTAVRTRNIELAWKVA